jgi:hypothetical protein
MAADEEIVLEHPDFDEDLTYTRAGEDDPFWDARLAQIAVYEQSGWKRKAKSKASSDEKKA